MEIEILIMSSKSPSTSLSNNTKHQYKTDGHTPNLDSTVRVEKVPLQLIPNTELRKDPLSWGFSGSIQTPSSSFKKELETKSLNNTKTSDHTQCQTLSQKTMCLNCTSDQANDYIGSGKLETDLDESDYVPSPNSITQLKQFRSPPKLSLIPKSKGETAWLRSSLLSDSSNSFFGSEKDLQKLVSPTSSINKDKPSILELQDQNSSNNNENHHNISKREIKQVEDDQSVQDYSPSKNIQQIENLIIEDYEKQKQFEIQAGYCTSSSVQSEHINELSNDECVDNLIQKHANNSKFSFINGNENLEKKRDVSNRSKLRFPSKSGGYWIPHLKPLSDFMDFRFEQKVYEFTEQEKNIIRKIDSILACKFCYKGFNIIMMIIMFLDISVFIIVSILYITEKMPKEIELIHILFFNLVTLFILFGINSCASREVRIGGQYHVKSYINIYWHLLRRKYDSVFDKEYLFIDDWYGDDKYKFMKAKLQEIAQLEHIHNNNIDSGNALYYSDESN